MKKDTSFVYGIIAYVGLVLGMLLSALWAFSAVSSPVVGIGAVLCTAVSLYAIATAEQKLAKTAH